MLSKELYQYAKTIVVSVCHYFQLGLISSKQPELTHFSTLCENFSKGSTVLWTVDI